MNPRKDTVWRSERLAGLYLDNVRAGVPMAAEQIDVMLRVVEAAVPRLGTCLDLGCGDGILGASLLERFPGARGVFADFSPAMLKAAEERLTPYGKRTICLEIDYGDGHWTAKLPEPRCFDAVVSGYSIHHQPNPRKRELYAEILELLNPGGIFVNVEHVESATPWVEERWQDLIIDSIHASLEVKGAPKTKEEVRHDFVNRPDMDANILAPVFEQCDWLRAIGYDDVDCYFKVFELAVFGGRKPRVS